MMDPKRRKMVCEETVEKYTGRMLSKKKLNLEKVEELIRSLSENPKIRLCKADNLRDALDIVSGVRGLDILRVWQRNLLNSEMIAKCGEVEACCIIMQDEATKELKKEFENASKIFGLYEYLVFLYLDEDIAVFCNTYEPYPVTLKEYT